MAADACDRPAGSGACAFQAVSLPFLSVDDFQTVVWTAVPFVPPMRMSPSLATTIAASARASGSLSASLGRKSAIWAVLTSCWAAKTVSVGFPSASLPPAT